MRKDLGAKAYLYPQPVLIITSYDEKGHENAMNAAWGGISDYKKISMCLDRHHQTVANIKARGGFTVAMADQDHVVPCDFVGIVSAKDDCHKMEKSGFTFTKSEKVDAPIINELPLCLECRLLSYNEESEIMVGEIVNVSADESILTNGKIDLSLFHPITFDAANAAYHVIGEKVGNAFRDGLALK